MLFRILISNEVPSLRSLFERTEQTQYNARHVPSDIWVLNVPRVASERAKGISHIGVQHCGILFLLMRCHTLAAFSKLYMSTCVHALMQLSMITIAY